MHEVLFIVSGMRLPVCMSLVNRALSAPINIWNDHQDSVSERDAGWLQFYVETAQEGYDLTLMQAKISENRDVLLPSMVCMDGFTLSHVYEPVDILSQEQVDSFLPPYKPTHVVLDPENPMTAGPIGFPSHYMEFRFKQHEAMAKSIKVIEEVYDEFNRKFPVQIPNSRPQKYWHIEEYKTSDADVLLVAMGSVCGTIKVVIDEMRKKGVKAGLVKIITYRPLPKEVLARALSKAKKIAVVEKAFSPGIGGVLVDEIKGILYDGRERPQIRSFIVGLGGRDVRLEHIEKIISMTRDNKGGAEEWMF
jgi:pyruvate ferredoxin oxidoreductase alpha subunit